MRPSQTAQISSATLLAAVLLPFLGTAAGCHDGPMYALKHANPYFTMHEWPADQRIAPTDAQREAELRSLVDTIAGMPAAEQQKWIGHLNQLMEHDQSGHMRALTVLAAAKASVPESLSVLEKGIDDDEFKVRMIAAQSLKQRQEPEATALLVRSINSETNKDVRIAAIRSLGNHRSPAAKEALKMAVQEPDLAYQYAAIASLKQMTGKDIGNRPREWVAYLESPEGSTSESAKTGQPWTERLRDLF